MPAWYTTPARYHAGSSNAATCAYIVEKNLVGTVKGRRGLSTTDPDLEKLWNDRIRLLEIDEEGQWDIRVKKILEESGYTVELYTS